MSCLLYESKGVGFLCVTTVQRSTDMEGEKWVGGGGGWEIAHRRWGGSRIPLCRGCTTKEWHN